MNTWLAKQANKTMFFVNRGPEPTSVARQSSITGITHLPVLVRHSLANRFHCPKERSPPSLEQEGPQH